MATIEYKQFGMFTAREHRLIRNCQLYANSDPAGLPGHNLMIIIAKQAAVLEKYHKLPMHIRDARRGAGKFSLEDYQYVIEQMSDIIGFKMPGMENV